MPFSSRTGWIILSFHFALIFGLSFPHSLARAAESGKILIEDFEDISDWEINISLERNNVIEGEGAGLWANTVKGPIIQKLFIPSLDLTEHTHLGFWLHSKVANGAQIQLVLNSENATTEGWDYYTRELTIDWEGWRWLWLAKDEMREVRSPIGWEKIDHVSLHTDGWDHIPLEDTELILDYMIFGKPLIQKITTDQTWIGNDYKYTLNLDLAEPYGSPLSLDITGAAPPELDLIVLKPHVDLPALGSTTVQISVTIPEAVIDQGAYLMHDLIIAVEGGNSAREEYREMIANPPPPRNSPRMLLTSGDFDRMNQWASKHSWARWNRSKILDRADSWRQSFLSEYGLNEIAAPTEGGQWVLYYVCPIHGVNLVFHPRMTHQCPVDGEILTGWPYDQVIYARQHLDLARHARDAGLAYNLTLNPTYARDVREILLLYANAYPGYPVHDITDKPSIKGGRVLAQTLDEAVWLIDAAWAYDLIASSGTLSAAEMEAIENNLLLPCALLIKRHNTGMEGWQVWHNAAMTAAGRATNDPTLVAFAINGERGGFHRHMAEGVLSDGFWYEGSWGYHMYELTPLTYMAEMGERGDFPLYPDPALKKMYKAPILFAAPDLTLPAFNDAAAVDLAGSAGWRFEGACRAYGDPTLALPLLQRPRGEEALFWGLEELPRTAPPVTGSMVFEGSDYTVLRDGLASDPWYLALDYGPHGDWHGHYDKLGFVFYARGELLGIDPGSHSYALALHDTWDRSTVAHNTVVVNETDQKEATGNLERFIDLGVCSFTRASAGEAYEEAALTRNLVMVEGYVLDRFEVRAWTGAQHKYDWIYHNPGELSHNLTTSPYSSFPDEGGYQHLSNNRAQTTTGDGKFDFVFPTQRPYPAGAWTSDNEITYTSEYSQEQAHSGDSSNKLHYDFGSSSGYINFRTKNMARFSREVPTGIAVRIFGDGSGNKVRLRIVDLTGESYVSPSSTLDFNGWQEIAYDNESTWQHWGGDNNNVLDLPISHLSLEVMKEDAGAQAGTLYIDDWRLTFPEAGEVLAEDFEKLAARERLWVKGSSNSTFVVGEGIGPDLTVPIPYVMVRRRGRAVDFDVLHEPYGTEPQITTFQPVPSDAPAEDSAVSYSVQSHGFLDRLILVGTGPGDTIRNFGTYRTNGTLAWTRKNIGGNLTRIALAEGSFIHDGTRELFRAPASVQGMAFRLEGSSIEILSFQGGLDQSRLYAPGTAEVTWTGEPVSFEKDGDYVIFGPLPFKYDLDGDGEVNDGDLSILSGSWQKDVPPASSEHDFDCDDTVGVGDLSWLATAWYKEAYDPTVRYSPACDGGSTPGPSSGTDIEVQLVAVSTPSASDTSSNLPVSLPVIGVGGTYFLEVWASDRGDVNSGITSAYIRLNFPQDSVSVLNASSSESFQIFSSGNLLPGSVTELGGSSLPGEIGIEPTWARIAILQVKADSPSLSVDFTLSASQTGFAAYGRGMIPWESIDLGSTSIIQGTETPFRRGDPNDDRLVNLSDVIFTLQYLFTGGQAPACTDAADANDDLSVDLSDGIALIWHLFEGLSIPEPFPGCGFDPDGGHPDRCVYQSCP